MSCGLTYESDRLPASWLRKSLSLKTQDSYLAGLWRGGLLAGLLWRRYRLTINSWGAYHRVFDLLLLIKIPGNDVLIAGSFDFPGDYEDTTTGSLFVVFLAGVSHPPHVQHATSNEGLFGLMVKKNEDESGFSRVGMLHGKFMAEDHSHSDEEAFTQYRSWRRQDYRSSTGEIESQALWCDISLQERERRVIILRYEVH